MGMRGRLMSGILALLGVLGGESLAARAAAPTNAEVPVTVTETELQDVPVYLEGLGTVQAYRTVRLEAQAGGVLLGLPAKEGQEVSKGDIIAQIDPAPYKAALDQALAQRAQDLAQLQSAQLDLDRYAKLAKSSYAPVQQVDDQRATVGKYQAAIQGDDASVETAKINLGYATIRAPFTGRVGLYQVDVGNLIHANGTTAILTVTQDKPIAMVFTLPEDQLLAVQEARAEGPLAVQVTAKDSDQPIATGTLITPDNTIDTATGTIALKARFANADDHLWPGQFVNARLQIKVLHDAVTLPSIAVQHGPEGLFVFQVKPDDTVAQVPISVGYDYGGLSVVTKGLSGHERIVLSGQSRLTPGTRVAPHQASGAISAAPAAEKTAG
jgi:multidrug efflux system membrane fusion protein